MLVVHERDAVANEDVVLDSHPVADECVALDLAVRPDLSAALNLDKGADAGVSTDPAAVQIGERMDDDVVAECHLVQQSKWRGVTRSTRATHAQTTAGPVAISRKTCNPGTVSSGVERVRSDIWAGVDRVIDRGPSLADLRSHGLHLLAAKRWRDLGRAVPEELAQEEIASGWLVLAAPHVLTRVRNACDGQLLVMKGPEVAGHYPDPASRPYGDLDILADDPEAAQRALVSAGFEPTGFGDGYYEGLHHLRPLRLRHCPLPSVEIHRRPSWVDWVDPPSSRELFAAAVPGSLPVPGLLALPPAHHALALAVHSWTPLPLRRIRDLIDILAVSADADRSGLDALAKRWGIGRLWNTM